MRNVLQTFTVILLMAIIGCESNMLKPLASDSSKEANIEDAKMALDDGNYQEAINDLGSENSSDPEVAGLLSSAYMGAAGLDLTYMLEKVDNSSTGNFDVIASAFNFQPSGQLSASSVLYKAAGSAESNTTGQPIKIYVVKMKEVLNNLAKAEKYLHASLLLDVNKNNEDLKVQLGICSALHFVLDIGYVIANVEGVVTGSGNTAIISIPTSKAAYQTIFPKGTDFTALGIQINTYLNTDTELPGFYGDLAGLQNDLGYVYTAVTDVFIKNLPNEDITTDFNNFMSEIVCPASSTCDIPTAIHSRSFSASTLADYINNKLVGNQ